DLRDAARAGPRLDDGAQHRLVPGARLVARKPWIAQQIRASDRLGEAAGHRLVGDRDDRVPVLGAVAVIGRTDRMAVADAPRLDPAIEILGHRRYQVGEE